MEGIKKLKPTINREEALTIYQATSIEQVHLLHSLPLSPGEKRMLILEW